LSGDPHFFRKPAKQVIAGSNNVLAPEADLTFGNFTMKFMKGLKFITSLSSWPHGDYYLPHTSAILSLLNFIYYPYKSFFHY